MSRSAEEEPHNLGNHIEPRILPGGQQIIVKDPVNNRLWIWDDRRRSLQSLEVEGVTSFALGPDTDEITYSRWGLDTAIYTRKIFAGPETEKKLADPGHFTFPVEWTEDEKRLICLAPPMWEIWMLSEGEPEQQIAKSAVQPDLSPNGKWIAFTDTVQREYWGAVFIQPFPGPGARVQISTGGGQDPFWTSNNEIIYRNRFGTDSLGFYSVSLEASPQGLEPAVPVRLFDGPYRSSVPIRSWDVHPEGRFLFMRSSGEGEAERLKRWNRIYPTEIRIIQNWVQTLEQKLPLVPN